MAVRWSAGPPETVRFMALDNMRNFMYRNQRAPTVDEQRALVRQAQGRVEHTLMLGMGYVRRLAML